MFFENGSEFLSNKAILITGATGFLAKILVEKILRIQPNVKKLYLLVRVNDTMSILDRFHNEIIQKDLFRVLKEQQSETFDSFISEKVTPVAGDTSLPDLGKNNIELREEIDAIIHVAGITKFLERYDIAFGINTMGAMNVLNFAHKCSNLQVLVHVSTAYVCGDKEGLIAETPCKMGETLSGRVLDIDEEKRLIDETLNNLKSKAASRDEIRQTMSCLGFERAKYYGWPNTYVFTKAMAEMIIWTHKKELPVVIVRPTMICSTFKEPFPGWVEGFGSASTVSKYYGRGYINIMHSNGESVFDMIPADMVVNVILVSMIANTNKQGLTIYHMGSSMRNPITYRKVMDLNFQYFDAFPWVNEKGLLVKIKSARLHKTQTMFLAHLALQFLVLQLLKLLKNSCGLYSNVDEDKYSVNSIDTRLKVTYKLVQLYRSYINFAGIFEDTNTQKLRRWMIEACIDEQVFDFNPMHIDWQDYLLKVQIPATVKYLF